MSEGLNNPHYDSKHGAYTTLEQQYKRAMNGTNPQTGGKGPKADASKFFNSTDMENALRKAEKLYAKNPNAYSNGNVSIIYNRAVGEGYMGNKNSNITNGIIPGEYRWTNTVTVGIDKNTGKAYTAYPNLNQGVKKADPLKH